MAGEDDISAAVFAVVSLLIVLLLLQLLLPSLPWELSSVRKLFFLAEMIQLSIFTEQKKFYNLLLRLLLLRLYVSIIYEDGRTSTENLVVCVSSKHHVFSLSQKSICRTR